MMDLVFFSILIIISILLIVNNAHLLRGTYIWEYSKPFFYLNFRIYMKYEYAIMKMVLKLASLKFFQRFKFFKMLF